MTNVPIRPELITWAREYRGLSQTQAAERLSISVDDFAAFERGAELPDFEFFETLSRRLKIPGGFLLRDNPPEMPQLPTDFRTIGGRHPKIGFETRVAISYAQTIAENINELVESESMNKPASLPKINLNQNPENVGETERSRLGVNRGQLEWSSQEAFGNWKTVIESAGTFVLSQPFPLEDCKGFTVFNYAEAPLIVISNEEQEPKAKTFTLVHEYAHLLLNEPGLSDQKEGHPVEAFCNKFAAAFLMPRNVIRELIGEWPNEPRIWDIKKIRWWSGRLKVSQQALALRLESLNLAPKGFYGKIIAQQGKASSTGKSSGGNHIINQISRLGDRLVYEVLDAEKRENITPFETAEILGFGPDYFDLARSMIEKRRLRMEVS